MAQRQFRSDDTDKWIYGFGSGVDDAYSSAGNATDAPIDSSCSGTSGTTSLSATNASFAAGQLIMIHQSRGTGVGGWELNKIQSYVAGTITTAHSLTMTYTDSGASQAQVIVMKQYTNFTQNSGHTLTLKAWDGNVGGILPVFVKGTLTITGTIYAKGNNATTGGIVAGTGYRGGIGQNYSASGYYGEGSAGASAASTSSAANGNGAGGGKSDSTAGNHGGAGGGGSYRTAGGNGSCSAGGCLWAGLGGSTVGNASGTQLFFGGGGGGVGANAGNQSHAGSGGGIVLFIANNIAEITGTVNINGGDASNWYNGSGGGAGGFCLIKCKTAVLGTNKITALGSTSSYNSVPGGNGGIHLDYKTSYTGTTNPTLDSTQDETLDWIQGVKFFNFI